jgi:hypothetical protein
MQILNDRAGPNDNKKNSYVQYVGNLEDEKCHILQFYSDEEDQPEVDTDISQWVKDAGVDIDINDDEFKIPDEDYENIGTDGSYFIYRNEKYGGCHQIQEQATIKRMKYYLKKPYFDTYRITKHILDKKILLCDANIECSSVEYIDKYNDSSDIYGENPLTELDKEILRKFNDGG